MLLPQANGTASSNGTVATDPNDMKTWTPEQVQAWQDLVLLWLRVSRDLKYLMIAVCTFVIYEYFITLHLEAELVLGWRHRTRKAWTIPDFLFFINRYFIFVVLAMSNLAFFWPEPPAQFCTFALRFNALSGIVITIVANASLIIRQYAFWNRSKTVLWSLVFVHSVSCIGNIVANVTGFRHMKLMPKWQRGLPTGCLPTPPEHVWASFVGVLVFDVILFNLTVIRAWQLTRGGSPSPITDHILASGSLYFGVMFVTTALTFIAAMSNNLKLANVLTPSNMVPAMMSIMCSRLLLHIRSDLKEAKTPHLQTRATADWPSSPISPDIEGMPYRIPWRDDLPAPRDSPNADTSRRSDDSALQTLERPISIVVHEN